MILRGWEDWNPQVRETIVEQLVNALKYFQAFPTGFSISELTKAQKLCGIRTWPQNDRNN
jgi:hypothetical protein